MSDKVPFLGNFCYFTLFHHNFARLWALWLPVYSFCKATTSSQKHFMGYITGSFNSSIIIRALLTIMVVKQGAMFYNSTCSFNTCGDWRTEFKIFKCTLYVKVTNLSQFMLEKYTHDQSFNYLSRYTCIVIWSLWPGKVHDGHYLCTQTSTLIY